MGQAKQKVEITALPMKGASVSVMADGNLLFEYWHFFVHKGPWPETPNDKAYKLAIIEWLRAKAAGEVE